MRFHTKTIVLITMALILYGCCRTTKCIQVTQEDTNPVASIKITYKDDAGTYQRITRRFDGSTSSMNYNLELPHNTDWKAYFKATSSSAIKFFKTKWRHEHNDIQQHSELWQEKDFSACPKKCWDRKLEFQDSVHGDVYGLHIYAENFNQKNSGHGNVYVRFSEPEQEPDLDSGSGSDSESHCESSGELSVSLSLDPNSGFPKTWTGTISQGDLDRFCEGLSITSIKLPRKVNCSLITQVCIQEWRFTIDGQEYTSFECNENSNYCTLDLVVPVPLDTQYQIEASTITHFPCDEPHQPCEDDTWDQYITVTFEIE